MSIFRRLRRPKRDPKPPHPAAPTGGHLSRRAFLARTAGLATGASLLPLASALAPAAASTGHRHAATTAQSPQAPGSAAAPGMPHGGNMAVGEVDTGRMGYDPMWYLTNFDRGRARRLPDGRMLREFQVVAYDKTIEIAPGLFFPAWTFNGTVPGPTLRAREGELLRVKFINAGTHPHTMHFHGIHRAEMDGVPGVGPGEIARGASTVYEFGAEPFGLHLYHCHTLPLKRHIHKGLYGVFIIDPKQGRPPARELVMMMNAFDTNFDGENEVYAINTVAFHYMKHPIRVRRGELVRIYLVNITEFDPVNSLHIHGNFFHVYRTGTRLRTEEFTDTIMLAQAERAVLEVRFPFAGRFMFHAHVSEFTELGWVGFFEVTDDGV
jgi:FtsP/CotA-like multicopper oxidase with cupredoxin domain